jgi:hypothetical protein
MKIELLSKPKWFLLNEDKKQKIREINTKILEVFRSENLTLEEADLCLETTREALKDIIKETSINDTSYGKRKGTPDNKI